MKVFGCKVDAVYGGGLAIVAANSKEEAFVVFHTDQRYEWMADRFRLDGSYIEDATKWYSDFYPLYQWFELTMLTANVDKPQVIAQDSYSE